LENSDVKEIFAMINIGESKGRGKLGGQPGKIWVPIKDIWVFPLDKKFRILLKSTHQ